MRRCLVPLALLVALLALAGGAAAAPRLYAPIYYHEPPAVSGFERQADGSLTPLSGSPFAVAGSPPAMSGMAGMAFAPDGRRAVATFYFEGGFAGLSVGPNGSIAGAPGPVATPVVSAPAVSPDGRFVYASSVEPKTPGIFAYSLGPDGALSPVAGSPFGKELAFDLALTPDGRFLYAASPFFNEVARYAVNGDGTLTPLGATPFAGASYLATSPDGRFLFVGSRESPGGRVASFSIGPDGGLTQNGEPALTGDTAMGEFAVAPDGRHVYMPDDNVDGIVTAAVASDGTLSVVGTTPLENPGTVAASPDGRFLYYAHEDAVGGKIGVASIGADGKPSVLPFTTPWESNEPERLVFQPPAASADFSFGPVAPGAPDTFQAADTSGANRYDWDFGDGTTLANAGPRPRHSYKAAGVYRVRLTVTDEDGGCSANRIYTGQSTVCPGSVSVTKSLDTLPKIGPLVLSNKAFAVAGGGGGTQKRGATASAKRTRLGTTLHYKLSEAAAMRFTIERRSAGRRAGRKCVAPSPKNRAHAKCSRFRSIGAFAARAKAGKNKTRFSGELKGRALPPGRYRVTAIATDSAGGRSAPRRAPFQIVGG